MVLYYFDNVSDLCFNSTELVENLKVINISVDVNVLLRPVHTDRKRWLLRINFLSI